VDFSKLQDEPMFQDIVKHAAQAGSDRVFSVLDNAFDNKAYAMAGSVSTLQLMLASCLRAFVRMGALKIETAHEAIDAMHPYLDALIDEKED
jgi:hypothetical protein